MAQYFSPKPFPRYRVAEATESQVLLSKQPTAGLFIDKNGLARKGYDCCFGTPRCAALDDTALLRLPRPIPCRSVQLHVSVSAPYVRRNIWMCIKGASKGSRWYCETEHQKGDGDMVTVMR
eukprot:scaffold69195_cov19-Tisochrysis_lutea.AAC.1